MSCQGTLLHSYYHPTTETTSKHRLYYNCTNHMVVCDIHIHIQWLSVFVITQQCFTDLCSVSLSGWASSNPAYIHTNPGPPSHRLPISMKTRFPVFPVRRILSRSHAMTGLPALVGATISSRPTLCCGTPPLSKRMWIPIMLHLDPTSSDMMYTAHAESGCGEGEVIHVLVQYRGKVW